MTKATVDHISDHSTDHKIDPDTMSQELLTLIDKWLAAEGAYTTPTQQQMLASHVKAMVMRAKTGESLPEVDLSLFDEISPESIKLAAQVVEILPELAVEEVYLLSVHFEIARSNP
ncbi:PRD domain-containing protein [Xenorhabdus sp. 12]|uniref:PRD domain-containing protein n=2 Tax=Xenorhabdus santafensis TaxID=2582833 RepID=A0ABU4S4E1_9GAMM|nr:PRD domain-containing protein [Xenorhabdus sp. 12]